MKNLKKISLYFVAPILSVLIFTALFQLWNLDLRAPVFSYEGDSIVAFFLIKNIIQTGWFSSNELVGWPHLIPFSLNDFPMHADGFNFLILKAFTYFSSDPFLIVNCFFILTFALTSFTSFIALRSLGITAFTAIIVSILYSFTPYHFYRGTWHVFLSNYSPIPLIIMVSLWIAAGKIKMIDVNEKGQFYLNPNRFFFFALAICIFVSGGGIYYALYSCVIFVFAWILYGLKKGIFSDRQFFTVTFLCSAIIIVLLFLHIPSFFYWMQNGMNGNAVNRSMEQSELYGLKIVNLLLPTENHYLEYFANLRKFYDESMWVYESKDSSLGLLGAVGFLFLLLWLFAKNYDKKGSIFQKTIQKFSLTKEDQNLIFNLAGLNLLIVLFATVGGLVMLFTMASSLLRCHARLSIFIAFLSLTLIAIIFDKIIKKKLFGKKIFAQILVVAIAVFSLFDQVGRVSSGFLYTREITNRKDVIKKFHYDREFIEKIEKTMPTGAMIMQMPAVIFPESVTYELMIGYIYSKNLRWSYPVIRGRESAIWQLKTAKLDFKDFIIELKKAGFSGVYIDRANMVNRVLLREKEDEVQLWRDLIKFEKQMKSIAKRPPLVSSDLRLVFFEI